jgi:hypothetical protein
MLQGRKRPQPIPKKQPIHLIRIHLFKRESPIRAPPVNKEESIMILEYDK